MFDTRKVGKKIAALRKERNKTQMELADEMGVSYQAVSNWERGNSMPDISKLPQLSLILGTSVDEILGESKEAQLLEHVIAGTEQTFLKEQETEVETIAEVAPLMKPEQTKKLVEHVVESKEEQGEDGFKGEKKKISVKELTVLAPYLEENYLEELVEKYGISSDMHSLAALAPYLSENALDKIALESEGSMKELAALAPFLSENALDKIALESEGSMKELAALAPFLSKETLDEIARKVEADPKSLTPLAPFLSKEILGETVLKALEKGNIENCVSLYPFLDDETLKKIADRLMKEQGAKSLQALIPFL